MTNEKQIKEIETIIKSNLAEGSFANAFARKVAIQIVEHYQPKLPENAVVIPEKITEETSPKDIIKIAKYNEKVRKETAREIYEAVIDQYLMAKFDRWRFKNWLSEKYGVEVE